MRPQLPFCTIVSQRCSRRPRHSPQVIAATASRDSLILSRCNLCHVRGSKVLSSFRPDMSQARQLCAVEGEAARDRNGFHLATHIFSAPSAKLPVWCPTTPTPPLPTPYAFLSSLASLLPCIALPGAFSLVAFRTSCSISASLYTTANNL